MTQQVLRGQARGKLRQEVEYMLHKGTCDNAYLLTPPGAVALVDVPYEAYADKFGENSRSRVRGKKDQKRHAHAVEALAGATSLGALTHVVITHLDPKAIPTLVRLGP